MRSSTSRKGGISGCRSLRGEADVNGHRLSAGDGLAASDETSFALRGAGAEAELLVFDLA